jgi:D-alanyl-D-alanine carboxypeptidase/D-alanyl-D-alanine-endopeptidase (penicillin-binding protein 4)
MGAAMIGRRSILAGGLAALAAPALSQTAPKARPSPAASLDMGQIIADAKLGGVVGYAVANAATGALLAQSGSDRPMPPASVTKAVTALYARALLGQSHSFTTQILATGPVDGGILRGDIILAGGGDPSFDTDRLGAMVQSLASLGLRRITGQFGVWGGALPHIDRISPDQPDHVGYNPTISGMMLNFNRAQFVWRRQGESLNLLVNAEGARFNPPVSVIHVRAARREAPLLRYESQSPIEEWSVALPALRQEGSRWLPVRAPLAYAGDVMRALCAAQSMDLPPPISLSALPQNARALVQDQSKPLDGMLRDMLRFSTNLTAEAVGLSASGAGDIASSARAMSDWAANRFGISARFSDHSGLSEGASCTPADMTRLMAAQAGSDLAALLRERRIDLSGRESKDAPLRVMAKSGTLNFVSNLSGYVTAPSGRALAFAIFAADAPRRAALPMDQREDPKGADAWSKRARAMQRQMIAAWGRAWL